MPAPGGDGGGGSAESGCTSAIGGGGAVSDGDAGDSGAGESALEKREALERIDHSISIIISRCDARGVIFAELKNPISVEVKTR